MFLTPDILGGPLAQRSLPHSDARSKILAGFADLRFYCSSGFLVRTCFFQAVRGEMPGPFDLQGRSKQDEVVIRMDDQVGAERLGMGRAVVPKAHHEGTR